MAKNDDDNITELRRASVEAGEMGERVAARALGATRSLHGDGRVANMAGRGGSAILDVPLVHGCGRSFVNAVGYAIHGKHCDGKKPKTEGRIAARQKTLAPVSRPHLRRQNRKRHAERTSPAIGTGAIVAAATDKAIEVVIAGLVAKRQAIDNAIAALQAVS